MRATPLVPMTGHGRPRRQLGAGNKNRDALLAAVQDSPGLTFRGLCRASGVSNGTARHHIETLRGHGLLVAFTQGCTLRHFPAGWTPLQAAVAVVEADPVLRRLLHAIGSDRVNQKTLIARLPDLPRSSTQHAANRLVQCGALRLSRSGRHVLYEVA